MQNHPGSISGVPESPPSTARSEIRAPPGEALNECTTSVFSPPALPAPLRGPTLQRLQDASPGTPTLAWEEVPRHELRGHLIHYTLCVRTEKWTAVSCRNGESPALCPTSPRPRPNSIE